MCRIISFNLFTIKSECSTVHKRWSKSGSCGEPPAASRGDSLHPILSSLVGRARREIDLALTFSKTFKAELVSREALLNLRRKSSEYGRQSVPSRPADGLHKSGLIRGVHVESLAGR